MSMVRAYSLHTLTLDTHTQIYLYVCLDFKRKDRTQWFWTSGKIFNVQLYQNIQNILLEQVRKVQADEWTEKQMDWPRGYALLQKAPKLEYREPKSSTCHFWTLTAVSLIGTIWTVYDEITPEGLIHTLSTVNAFSLTCRACLVICWE
jgi:hypothetical protein